MYMVIGGIALLLILIKYRYASFGEGFQSGVDTFTLYYASWCPHCKDIKPVFAEWGADKGSVQIKGKTVFVKMIEEQQMKDDDVNKSLVRGYPTFILNRAENAKGVEFEGERSTKGWEDWLGKNI